MTIKDFDTYIEFYLKGDIDVLNCNEFKGEVLKQYDKHKKDVVFDCKELSFIDSTGLGAFVAINNYISKNHNKLKLNSVIARIYKLFTITGLDKIMTVNE